MLRLFLPLGCSLALHLVLGWWLRDAWLESARPMAGAAEVFEVSLEPVAAPVRAAAPVPAPATLLRPEPVRKPALAKQSSPAAQPKALPAEAPAVMASVAQAVSAPPSLPVASRPEPVTPSVARVLPEVLVQRPSFRQAPTAPRYPVLARQRRLQGVVWVEVRIGVQGEQRERRLLRSSGVPMLDRAALEAVQAWQFNPELVGGQAVPSRVQIPIEFNLLAAR